MNCWWVEKKLVRELLSWLKCWQIFLVYSFLFCLQIKRDLADNTLQCNDNTAALMASYIVQGKVFAIFLLPHRYRSCFHIVAFCFSLCAQPHVAIMWLKTIPITPIYHRIALYRIKTLRCNEKLWRITRNMCKWNAADINWYRKCAVFNSDLFYLPFSFFTQRANARRSRSKFARNSETLRTVWHENASSQRHWRCST